MDVTVESSSPTHDESSSSSSSFPSSSPRRVQHHFRVHRLPSLLLLQQADALPALRTLRQVLRRPLPAVHSRSSTHENESTTGVQDLGFEVWDVLSESQFSASTTFKSLKRNPIPAPKPKAGEEFADALFTELVPWGKDQTFTGLTHGTPSPASNVKISLQTLSLSLSRGHQRVMRAVAPGWVCGPHVFSSPVVHEAGHEAGARQEGAPVDHPRQCHHFQHCHHFKR